MFGSSIVRLSGFSTFELFDVSIFRVCFAMDNFSWVTAAGLWTVGLQKSSLALVHVGICRYLLASLVFCLNADVISSFRGRLVLRVSVSLGAASAYRADTHLPAIRRCVDVVGSVPDL